MRKNTRLSFLFFIFLLSCNLNQSKTKSSENRQDSENQTWEPPASGTLIDEVKQKIKEDDLNDRYFLVQVFATDESRDGVYRLNIAFGYYDQETEITFPRWLEGVYPKPVLKASSTPYELDLGFNAGDTSFREYYKISVGSNNISLKKVRDYRLSRE